MHCISRIIRNLPIKNIIPSHVKKLSTHQTLAIQPHPSAIAPILFNKNPWIYEQNDKIKSPIINNSIFELPNGLRYVPPMVEPEAKSEILDQPTEDVTIEAARLIVIRRKKMKKHKLRKLRKRMKFEWAKLRQKRELKKEKAFQAVLIRQCKEADNFSAEQYVEERIKKLNDIVSATGNLIQTIRKQ